MTGVLSVALVVIDLPGVIPTLLEDGVFFGLLSALLPSTLLCICLDLSFLSSFLSSLIGEGVEVVVTCSTKAGCEDQLSLAEGRRGVK